MKYNQNERSYSYILYSPPSYSKRGQIFICWCKGNFQSDSDWSCNPKIPSILTGTTSPAGNGLDPISQTYVGSLSPGRFVQGSWWGGFSRSERDCCSYTDGSARERYQPAVSAVSCSSGSSLSSLISNFTWLNLCTLTTMLL